MSIGYDSLDNFYSLGFNSLTVSIVLGVTVFEIGHTLTTLSEVHLDKITFR